MSKIVISNKDFRIIIESFLDVPSLNSLLLTLKPSYYGRSRNYKTYIKKSLIKKKKECLRKWNYHFFMPNILKNINKLNKTTFNNLKKLEEKNYIWNKKALIWLIERTNLRKASDIMIPGYHPDKGYVQYWRHETSKASSGQTLIIWYEKNKKKSMRVSFLKI
jgi:cellulose biosynthesis protein BcsQ